MRALKIVNGSSWSRILLTTTIAVSLLMTSLNFVNSSHIDREKNDEDDSDQSQKRRLQLLDQRQFFPGDQDQMSSTSDSHYLWPVVSTVSCQSITTTKSRDRL